MNSKISSDRVVSFSAIFISLLTLVIFIYQTNLMRKQNFLSILPYLSVDTSINHVQGTFTLELKNLGIGPAIIESRKIKNEEKWMDIDFVDFLQNFIQQDSSISIRSTTLTKGTAIPANSSLILIKVFMSPEKFPDFMAKFENLQANGIDYEIIYRSIYDEKWKINSSTDLPIKMD